MDKDEVIDILRKREEMLLDCKLRKEAQKKELERLRQDIAEDENVKLCEMYEDALRQTSTEEKKINYVWFYFLQLPQKQRELLNELYVNRCGWEYVLHEFPGTKSKWCRQKELALDSILKNMQEMGEE